MCVAFGCVRARGRVRFVVFWLRCEGDGIEGYRRRIVAANLARYVAENENPSGFLCGQFLCLGTWTAAQILPRGFTDELD